MNLGGFIFLAACQCIRFISAVEFQGEVPYQELWEQEIELPSLEERTVLKSYGDESEMAMLLVQAEPLDMGVDDPDLIVTDCETKDIFRDNLGYSYTYATEKLLIDIGKLSSICLHIYGNKRKRTSAFHVNLELVSEEDGLAYVLGDKDVNQMDIYRSWYPGYRTFSAGNMHESSGVEVETSNLEYFGSILVEILSFILKVLA